MIEPRHRIIHGLDGRRFRHGGTAQQNHREAERARRSYLAVGRGSAAILGDDDFDRVRAQQSAVIRFGEWSATGHIGRAWHRERRIDRLDAAHQIGVLWRLCEASDIAPAQREKDPPRRWASACTAASGSATSVQLSPARGTHGGRRSANRGTRASAAASAAFDEMLAAMDG